MEMTENHICRPGYRQFMTFNRATAPQGTDERPYDLRTYRLYDIYVDSVGNSLVILLLLVAYPMMHAFPTIATFYWRELLYPLGNTTVVFLIVASAFSIIQDIVVRLVSARWVGNPLNTAFSYRYWQPIVAIAISSCGALTYSSGFFVRWMVLPNIFMMIWQFLVNIGDF